MLTRQVLYIKAKFIQTSQVINTHITLYNKYGRYKSKQSFVHQAGLNLLVITDENNVQCLQNWEIGNNTVFPTYPHHA